MQTVLEQHAANLTSLMNGQKATHRIVTKTQASVERVTAEQSTLSARVDKLAATTDQTTTATNQHTSLTTRLDKLQTSTDQSATTMKQQNDKQHARLERQVTTTLETHATKMQAAQTQQQRDFNKLCQQMLTKLEEIPPPMIIQHCDHDVIPPPRKMNRKLLGYVYSRV